MSSIFTKGILTFGFVFFIVSMVNVQIMIITEWRAHIIWINFGISMTLLKVLEKNLIQNLKSKLIFGKIRKGK